MKRKMKPVTEVAILEKYAVDIDMERNWGLGDFATGKMYISSFLSLRSDLGLERLQAVCFAAGTASHTNVEDLMGLAIQCVPSLCMVARLSNEGSEVQLNVFVSHPCISDFEYTLASRDVTFDILGRDLLTKGKRANLLEVIVQIAEEAVRTISEMVCNCVHQLNKTGAPHSAGKASKDSAESSISYLEACVGSLHRQVQGLGHPKPMIDSHGTRHTY